jgi:putative acyl-CoA dehydrogenase
LEEIRLGGARVAKSVEGVHGDVQEEDARSLAERLGLGLQGSLMVRFSPPAIADAFCASRLEGNWGRAFGTLPRGVDIGSVLDAV